MRHWSYAILGPDGTCLFRSVYCSAEVSSIARLWKGGGPQVVRHFLSKDLHRFSTISCPMHMGSSTGETQWIRCTYSNWHINVESRYTIFTFVRTYVDIYIHTHLKPCIHIYISIYTYMIYRPYYEYIYIICIIFIHRYIHIKMPWHVCRTPHYKLNLGCKVPILRRYPLIDSAVIDSHES